MFKISPQGIDINGNNVYKHVMMKYQAIDTINDNQLIRAFREPNNRNRIIKLKDQKDHREFPPGIYKPSSQ